MQNEQPSTPADDIILGRWYLIHSSPPPFHAITPNAMVPVSPWLLPGCPIRPAAIDHPFLIGHIPLSSTSELLVQINLTHYTMRPASLHYVTTYRRLLQPGLPHPSMHNYYAPRPARTLSTQADPGQEGPSDPDPPLFGASDVEP